MKLLRFFIASLALVLGAATGVAKAPMLVARIEPSMLSSDAITFNPGVFRLDDASNKITPICIPSRGAWVQPGGAGCPVPAGAAAPPAALRYQMGQRLLPGVHWVIANLGIDSAQWARAAGSKGELGAIAASVQLQTLPTTPPVIQYRFNSATLPPMLNAEVPGGGIYVHMQDMLPASPAVYPFARPGEALRVDTRLALPMYQMTGGATDGITIGLSFQTVNNSGHLVPVSLLVSLFNSKGLYREYVSTDGRNVFAASDLSGVPAFLTPAATAQLVPGQPAQTFSFRITDANMAALVAALNVYLENHGKLSLDTNMSLVRLHQVDLRNESARLDKGTARLSLNVEFVRASIVSN